MIEATDDGSPFGALSASMGNGVLLFLLVAVLLVATHCVLRARPESLTPANAPRWSTAAWLRIMFLASGCAAMIYEIVWLHLLRLVIGASALSVAVVVATFMGGMLLGSLLAPRLARAVWHPLVAYGAIELAIGVLGLLVPVILPVTRSVYADLLGYGVFGIAVRGLIAAVLLMPPAALMGATLPVVARLYEQDSRGSLKLAALYAANVLGAVLGTLLAGFYILAYWDVWTATFVAGVLNFTVGSVALWRARGTAVPPSRVGNMAAASGGMRVRHVYLLYIATGLSGMAALGAQVVWTRLLALLFGATVYAFTIILAVFLAGMAMGSAAGAFLLRRGADPLRAFALCQLALIPVLLAASHLLGTVLPYTPPPATVPISALHVLHMLRAVELIGPAAFIWGLSFALAIAAGTGAHADFAISSGRVYAANTLGGVLGALVVSVLGIPFLGSELLESVLIMTAALSSAILLLAVAKRRAAVSGHLADTPYSARLDWCWPLVAGCLSAALVPPLPATLHVHGRYLWGVHPSDRYAFIAEGVASTVAVRVGPGGHRYFHVSGRVEASTTPKDMRLQRMLGHLSALAHPRPRSVLVVGLGSGITGGAFVLHPEVERIVICEIEPRVVDAAGFFREQNHDLLLDERVELVFDDARHFLSTTSERFDVITSDPIHPWVRGNSVLFTSEYYDAVQERLADGGLASQWVPLYETSEYAIQMQMRTFFNAFPGGAAFSSDVAGRGYDLVLLGADGPLSFDLASMQSRLDSNTGIAEALREVGVESAADLVATYAAGGADMSLWLAGIPVNGDFSLALEYVSGVSLNRHEADEIFVQMTAARTYPENMFVADPETSDRLRDRMGFPVISAGL